MLPNQTRLFRRRFLYPTVVLRGSSLVEYSEYGGMPLQFFSELIFLLNPIQLICPESGEQLWS
jgi:hypothetical protein